MDTDMDMDMVEDMATGTDKKTWIRTNLVLQKLRALKALQF
jgi:hypothetical protein